MVDRLYLDHAATAPMTPAARSAMADGAMSWANPSSPHAEGRGARAALEKARAAIASAYGWTCETLLTSGASESLAIALGRSVIERRVITSVEHDAVLRAAGDAIVAPVDRGGVLHLDRLRSMLADASPATVAVQWANSETGVRQDIAAVAGVVHDAGGLLLVDGAQMPAGIDEAPAHHADFIALSAHKRGGPPGIGALLVRDLATLHPTGGQERGYRGGTENMPATLGYAAALAEPEDIDAMTSLRALLDDAIERSGGEVIGAGSRRHPSIGSYRMPGVASAAQLIRFDLAGIAVSAGSACSSGSMKPSHVMAAMGWVEQNAREIVRISFGRSTSEADIDRVIGVWRGIARQRTRFAA